MIMVAKSKKPIKKERKCYHFYVNLPSDEEDCENLYRCAKCNMYFEMFEKRYYPVYLEFSKEDGRIIRNIPYFMIGR